MLLGNWTILKVKNGTLKNKYIYFIVQGIDEPLIGLDPSCLFPNKPSHDYYLDLMWIHKTAKDVWKKKNEKCKCEWKTDSLMLRTCQYNSTFSITKPIQWIHPGEKSKV